MSKNEEKGGEGVGNICFRGSFKGITPHKDDIWEENEGILCNRRICAKKFNKDDSVCIECIKNKPSSNGMLLCKGLEGHSRKKPNYCDNFLCYCKCGVSVNYYKHMGLCDNCHFEKENGGFVN